MNGGKIFVTCFTMLFGDGEIRVYEREGILLAVSLLVVSWLVVIFCEEPTPSRPTP